MNYGLVQYYSVAQQKKQIVRLEFYFDTDSILNNILLHVEFRCRKYRTLSMSVNVTEHQINMSEKKLQNKFNFFQTRIGLHNNRVYYLTTPFIQFLMEIRTKN